MFLFNNCPVEISTSILSYLPNVDLARVCRVSHHVGAIATPLLYTAPILVDERHRGSSALDILLRTLLMPEGDKLTVHVRSLTIFWDHFEHNTVIPTCPIDTALFVAASASLGLCCSTHGDKVTVLLCLLPYVTQLELGSPLDCDAFNRLVKSPHAAVLQHLRVFRHNPLPRRHDVSRGSIGVPELLELLRLPQLRSIDIQLESSTMSATPADTTAASARVGTSSITSLSLRNCMVTPSALSPLLRLPKALTHLHFAPETSVPSFDISSLSLDAVKHSLKHLHIDLCAVRQYDPRPHCSRQPLGSLRDYTALQTLRCSLQCLLGVDVRLAVPRLSALLPPQLTKFEVLGDRYWVGKFKFGKVFELLAEKRATVPGLKKVAMSVGRSRETLVEACEDAGVELVVRPAVAAMGIIRTKVQRCWRGANNGSGLTM